MHWFAPLRAWMVTRYADCRFVLRDSGLFAADPSRVRPDEPAPPGVQGMDPPRSQAFRGAIGQALRGVESAEAETALTDRAAELLAARGGEPFDAIEDFIRPLVLRAVHLALGVPEPDPATFAPHLVALERLMDAGLRPEAVADTAPSREYVGRLVADWCAAPAEGSPLQSFARWCGEAGVSEADFQSTVRFMALSTSGSVAAAVGNALLALLRGPDGPAVLAPLDRAGLDRAADELLRYDGPVQAVTRIAAADLTLGGRQVARGQEVIALVAAANRDPEAFERPDEIVLDRAPNPHLAPRPRRPRLPRRRPDAAGVPGGVHRPARRPPEADAGRRTRARPGGDAALAPPASRGGRPPGMTAATLHAPADRADPTPDGSIDVR
ncbi:cytochrome P450 [Actinomadura keratinilytica]|uniref:cytochrome P450 n=1 Tax=Actinomadura keratinilytica TaxID=547461 RepID=UPI003614BB6B